MSGLELHAIIIKKPYDMQTALEDVANITRSNKKHLMRETSQSYRFRVIPKTRFSQFFTKKVNPKISLVFGTPRKQGGMEPENIPEDTFSEIDEFIADTVRKIPFANTQSAITKLNGQFRTKMTSLLKFVQQNYPAQYLETVGKFYTMQEAIYSKARELANEAFPPVVVKDTTTDNPTGMGLSFSKPSRVAPTHARVPKQNVKYYQTQQSRSNLTRLQDETRARRLEALSIDPKIPISQIPLSVWGIITAEPYPEIIEAPHQPGEQVHGFTKDGQVFTANGKKRRHGKFRY